MAFAKGQKMWVAYVGEVRRVEVIQKGTGGTRFKKGSKPKDPYVVYDEIDEEEFVMGSDDLHHNPRDAQIAAAELQKKHGAALEDFTNNPLEPGDDEEEVEEEEEDGDEDD